MTSSWSSPSGSAFLVVGLLLGMRHALEPDHLAAVSTLVTERQRAGASPLAGSLLGMLWGLGHTVALLVVASLLAVAGKALPDRVALLFELAVAVMLVALGSRSIRRAWSPEDAASAHRRRAGETGDSSPPRPPARPHSRSVVIGLVHGLAGSGALTALVASRFPTVAGRLATVSLFGAGSMLGMAALSGLAGWPLARLGRDPRVGRLLAAVAGLVALVLGFAWGWPLVRQLIAA